MTTPAAEELVVIQEETKEATPFPTLEEDLTQEEEEDGYKTPPPPLKRKTSDSILFSPKKARRIPEHLTFDLGKHTLITVVHFNNGSFECIDEKDVRSYSVPNLNIGTGDRRMLWRLDDKVTDVTSSSARRLMVLLGDDCQDQSELKLTEAQDWGLWQTREQDWGGMAPRRLGRSYDAYVHVVLRD